MELVAQLASAFVPMVLIGLLAVIAVLSYRLVRYARQAKQAREDVRVLETLMAEGFSPYDADEAVRATREEEPLS